MGSSRDGRQRRAGEEAGGWLPKAATRDGYQAVTIFPSKGISPIVGFTSWRKRGAVKAHRLVKGKCMDERDVGLNRCSTAPLIQLPIDCEPPASSQLPVGANRYQSR